MQQLNGWLNINKPKGVTSTHVIRVIKKHLKPFNLKKIGHAGTLDPLATGILPIALGEATKTIPYMVDKQKDYFFTVTFGIATDSDDSEGKVIKTCDYIPKREDILRVLYNFKGRIKQTPPIFSAIKINGQRAYDLARNNELFTIKERDVCINDIKLVEVRDNEADFVVNCEKGTYVRSLARDIALKLGTFGHITTLKRLKVGNFSIDKAILLEVIENILYNDISSVLLPVGIVLDDIPVLSCTPEEAKAIRYGQCIISKDNFEENAEVVLTFDEKLLAIAFVNNNHLKPKRVFNL